MTNVEDAPNTAAGEYLRAARRAADLTQPELAERSGVGVRTISLLETGRSTNVRIGTLGKLARALNIDENHLTSAYFGGTPTQQPLNRSADHPQNDRAHVPMPVDTLTAVFNAITTFLADDDSSAARNHIAAAAGELFTAYAIALLERAAAQDSEQHGYLVSLIKMQIPAFPDDGDERNYLRWMVGDVVNISSEDKFRYESRWSATAESR